MAVVIPAVQSDRNHAADLGYRLFNGLIPVLELNQTIKAIVCGEVDDHPAVQEFAKYREELTL